MCTVGQPTVKFLGGGPVLCSSPLLLITDPKDINSNLQNPACKKLVPTQSIARLVRMGQKHRTKGRERGRKGEDKREGER